MRDHQAFGGPRQSPGAAQSLAGHGGQPQPGTAQREIALCRGKIALQSDLRADIRARQSGPATFDPTKPQRPVELRRAACGGELAVERGALGAAAFHADPRCSHRQRPGESVIEPPGPLQLDPHRAVIAFDQRTGIDQRHVDRGQARRLLAVGEDQRIQRAEAECAAAIAAEQPRTFDPHAPHFRPLPADAKLHHHAPRGEIGPRGIADHEVFDHLRLGADRDDIVGRGNAVLAQVIVEKIARDPLAVEPCEAACDQRHHRCAKPDPAPPPARPQARTRGWRRSFVMRIRHRHCLLPLRPSAPKGNDAAGRIPAGGLIAGS